MTSPANRPNVEEVSIKCKQLAARKRSNMRILGIIFRKSVLSVQTNNPYKSGMDLRKQINNTTHKRVEGRAVNCGLLSYGVKQKNWKTKTNARGYKGTPTTLCRETWNRAHSGYGSDDLSLCLPSLCLLHSDARRLYYSFFHTRGCSSIKREITLTNYHK